MKDLRRSDQRLVDEIWYIRGIPYIWRSHNYVGVISSAYSMEMILFLMAYFTSSAVFLRPSFSKMLVL